MFCQILFLWRGATVVIIESNSRCVKMVLPNNKVVDILSTVFDEIYKWLQNEKDKPESGGFIVGYQHKYTGNISLEEVSHPYELDQKNRIRFNIIDPRHRLFLKRTSRKKSYYMGTWHTHPQDIPVPSDTDWDDWHATMVSDTTGSQYVFFIIAGTKEIRIWAGDFVSGQINELTEANMNEEGLYVEN